MTTVNVFDFINDISSGKKDIVGKGTHDIKDYVPFLTNRAMSNYVDTVLYANEMNMYADTLGKDQQYYYYFHTVRKATRFSGKWAKTLVNDDIEAIKSYYKLNNQKAAAALKLLSREQIDILKKKVDHGGNSKQGGSN